MDHRRAGHIVFAGLSPRTLSSLWNRGVFYRVLDVDLLSRNGFECLVAPCPRTFFEIDSYFGWLAHSHSELAIESIALPILDLYLHPVYQIGRKIR